jgi:hypothetical protein
MRILKADDVTNLKKFVASIGSLEAITRVLLRTNKRLETPLIVAIHNDAWNCVEYLLNPTKYCVAPDVAQVLHGTPLSDYQSFF